MPRGPNRTHSSYSSLSAGGKSPPLGIWLLAGLNVIGVLFALPLVGRLLGANDPAVVALAAGLSLLLVAGLVFTYGLVTIAYWGWVGTLVVNVLGALLDLLTFDVLGLLVSALVVAYLFAVHDRYDA
ncbi:hypothetical protein [Halosegnis marinus]|uniref:SPW repeat-containing protein n=1 Tax=Halosegnis marinus TaxID=3034023 RepID=A0ABD5ZSP4_9EURY|nr:hypothetical protein [Halosegnis sp. DT85]